MVKLIIVSLPEWMTFSMKKYCDPPWQLANAMSLSVDLLYTKTSLHEGVFGRGWF